MATLTRPLVTGYEGKSMREICPHGYDRTADNHCAHFVSHVLQLGFGMTCARLRGYGNAVGAANVRVHEIFAQCPETREIVECPTRGSGIVFISDARSFHGSPTMLRNVPKKHVAIVIDGIVWHYSNPRNRVIHQTVGDFLHHYPHQQNALWWGTFPRAANAAPFGTSSL